MHHARGLTGAVGGAVHGSGDLVQGGGGFFQRGGLLLGATRQVVRSLADLARTRTDGGDVGHDHGDGLFQLGDGGVEVRLQLRGLGREGGFDPVRQIALRHGVQPLGQGGDGDVVVRGVLGPLGLDARTLVLDGLTLGCGLGLQAGVGDGGVLEGRHGRGHLADLVLAAHGRDDDRGVAAGEATHGRGHRQQGLAEQVGQQEGHGGGDDQGQNNAADQHHARRLGHLDLDVAEDASLFGLLGDQRTQGVLGRADVLVGCAFTTDHGHGLGIGRRVDGQSASGLHDVLGPFVSGGVGRADFIAAGRIQLGDAVQALVEILAVRGQALQIIDVVRQQEAAIAAFLTRQIELRGLGLALHRRGAGAIHPRLLHRVHLHEHRHAHDGDGGDDDGEGRHQFSFDLQIAQHAHWSFPPELSVQSAQSANVSAPTRRPS
ncbi:hypothetical protein D3C80_1089410 [compost metagenome]